MKSRRAQAQKCLVGRLAGFKVGHLGVDWGGERLECLPGLRLSSNSSLTVAPRVGRMVSGF